jgi:hypothetical protein
MLSAIATLIMLMILILLPVLIPATLTALHALAQLRRRLTDSRGAHDRNKTAVEPSPASA